MSKISYSLLFKILPKKITFAQTSWAASFRNNWPCSLHAEEGKHKLLLSLRIFVALQHLKLRNHERYYVHGKLTCYFMRTAVAVQDSLPPDILMRGYVLCPNINLFTRLLALLQFLFEFYSKTFTHLFRSKEKYFSFTAMTHFSWFLPHFKKDLGLVATVIILLSQVLIQKTVTVIGWFLVMNILLQDIFFLGSINPCIFLFFTITSFNLQAQWLKKNE